MQSAAAPAPPPWAPRPVAFTWPARRLDRPRVAGMQERRQIRLLLRARGFELLAHQVVVDGRFDVAEDADRSCSARASRQAGQRERMARLDGMRVVDQYVGLVR